ncbi:hypothetical protein L6164_000912 [Bauhinia variegata]|uniref:Uncharacterized protein n=1 Tax=Bauhinia variegata TaxID=167791 RepID=A0ACB9Q847_BAUVA|nr:hypothetical protein L6164_000912 [Bauhinia variegata]
MASAKSHKMLSASYQKINLAPDEETSALSELLIDIPREKGDQVDSPMDAGAPDGITASGKQNFEMHKELESDLPLPKPWMMYGIWKDLLLLENQLPMFVPVKLYDDFIPIFLKDKYHCFYQLAIKYFFNPDDQFIIPSYYEESKHFTDMLRYTQLPTAYNQLEYKQEECFHKLKTAIKLDAAGITLEKQTSNQKIEFKNGKFLNIFPFLSMIPWMKCFKARFIIPKLNVDETTEVLYRNIIALEQCPYPEQPYIFSYIAILDRLIDNEEDIDFLMNKEIINHTMGSNK